MKQIFTFLAVVLLTATTFAQVGIGTTNPDGSAALDITSTTKGLLIPRMTNAQRLAIASPVAGLLVYVTDFDGGTFLFYNGTDWKELSLTQARTAPDAPTITGVVSGNAQATVSFTAPSSNGGSAITSYTATSSPGGLTGTVSQSGDGTITVTGLTNGTGYTFTVTATNAIGTSVASAASSSVTPLGAPSSPTITGVVSGDAQVAVSFTAPSSNGGSAITSYTATSSPGGFTGAVSQSGDGTITVSGLTNGTPYTFTVTATNAIGTSVASAASSSVTPLGAPSSPTITGVVSGDAQVAVSFTAPSSNGGSAITSYTATSSLGSITGTISQSGDGTITVTGLTNGTPYTFTVTATNAIGTSVASAASSLVTPLGSPSSPTITGVVTGDEQVTVSFSAPSSNGGSVITSYTATSSPGGLTGTVSQSGSGSITVSGLTNGTGYTFTVTATNAIGTSVASAASASVTPGTYTILDEYTDLKPTGTNYNDNTYYNQYIDAGSIDASPFVITKQTAHEGGILFYGTTELISMNSENTFRLTASTGNFDFISFNLFHLESNIDYGTESMTTLPRITLTTSSGSTVTYEATVSIGTYPDGRTYYNYRYMESGVKSLNWVNVEWVDIKTQYTKAKTKDFILKKL
jgi:hypothetical protein